MVEALGINLQELIFAIINFLILVGTLTFFLYKPVLKMFDTRSNTIKDTLDNANAVNARADAKMEAYNKRIAGVEAEAREIVKNSKLKAEAQAQTIIEEAHAEAAKIKEKAAADIERERQQAMTEMKGQIAALAVLAAEKILEKEIAVSGQDEIINGILEQAGTSGWQN